MKVHEVGPAGRLCVTRVGTESAGRRGNEGGPSMPPVAQSDMNLNQCDGERWKGRWRRGAARGGGEREEAGSDSWDSNAVTVKVLR